MMKKNHIVRSRSGYTLIELLLVLSIVGVLAAVGFYSLGTKSPRAVRSGLVTLRAALFDARQAALSSGQTVKLTMSSASAIPFQLLAIDDITLESRVAFTLEPSIIRHANLAPTIDDLPNKKVQELKAAENFGFDAASKGWKQNLVGTSSYGFSPTGRAVGIAADHSITPLTGGFWVGLVASSINTKGVAYGVVLVTEQGQIISFYKGDSELDDTPEHQWQRLE